MILVTQNPQPGHLYTIEHVHDGDTFTAVVDADGLMLERWRIRLASIDCPEISSTSRKLTQWEIDHANQARDMLGAWLAANLDGGVTAQRIKWDNYGRPLYTLTADSVPALDDQRTAARALVMAGLAVPSDGRSSTPKWYQVYPDPGVAA